MNAMTVQRGPTVKLPINPLDQPYAEVTRAYFCLITGCSKVTALSAERSDPLWPRPVVRGGRVFYKASACRCYLESVQPLQRNSRSSAADSTC
jgi:hypothetical protein